MKKELKTRGSGGGWSKIVEFNKMDCIHKFTAQAVSKASPSFILKHSIFDIDTNIKIDDHKYPCIIYDINEMGKEDITKFVNNNLGLSVHADELIPNLLYYINRRKKIIKNECPNLSTEEIDNALKSARNRWSIEFRIPNGIGKRQKLIRVSLANVEIYNKEYYLFAIQQKVKSRWTVEFEYIFISVYKLKLFKLVPRIKHGILGVPDAIFHYSNGKVIEYPVFHGFNNPFMREQLQKLVNMALDHIKETGKEKPFLKLRVGEYTMYNTYVYGMPSTNQKYIGKDLALIRKLRIRNKYTVD